jgi:hypothetical protein
MTTLSNTWTSRDGRLFRHKAVPTQPIAVIPHES